MTEPVPQDTPIHRVNVAELPNEQLVALIERKRQRRLKAYEQYQAAVKLKAENQEAKDSAALAKRMEQFKKQLVSCDKNLDKLELYAAEIQGLRLALGDM